MNKLLRLFCSNRAFGLSCGLFIVVLITLLAVDVPTKAQRRLDERIASGKAVPHHFYVPVYLWRGLALNAGLAALLAGACWWAGRKLEEEGAVIETSAHRYTRLEKQIMAGIIIFAALQGWQRLDLSTWGDEDYTIKTYVREQVTVAEDGTLQFSKTAWPDIIWHGKRPNNHFGYTALARLSHDLLHRPGTGPTDPFFSERAARFPAYAAGLGSIVAIAWMARVWGWAHGVWMLLIFYVVHPWFVRHGSDARGYSIVLLGLPIIFGAAGRALQTGRWRLWLLLSLVQAFTFWCYWGVFYVLLPLQLGLLWAVLSDRTRQASTRRILAARWLVSGLLFSMVIIQLMAPNLPQLLDFVRQNAHRIHGVMDFPWWQDALGHLLFGTPWNDWAAGNPLCVSLSQTVGLERIAVLVAGAFVLGGFGFGVWRMMRDVSSRWLLLPIFGGPVLFFTHMVISGVKPYHWYQLLFFPGFLIPLAVTWNGIFRVVDQGLAATAKHRFRPLPKSARPRFSLLTGVLSFGLVQGILLSWVLSEPQRRLLLRHPIEPCRESVALTRKITNPHHPDFGKDSITAGFTMFTEAYDPTLVRFETVGELEALIAMARATHRELFINFSSRGFCESAYPELFKLFNDPARFELVARLPGQFDAATREVLRAR